jgi:hypothetical protein
MAEGEKVQYKLNRHMIVEKLEPSSLGQRIADCHLADGWWPKNHYKLHNMYPISNV